MRLAEFLRDERKAALAVAAIAAAMLAAAFAFEHVGGLRPCPLCWQQRYAWMIGGALALAAAALPGRGIVHGLAIGASGIAIMIGAGIALDHFGIELGWWKGPESCSAASGAAMSIDALRERILTAPIVRCDVVAWSFLGISMAGWNALIAAPTAALALAASCFKLRCRKP
jgi:disulfide bond formation protein DsbB